MTILKTTLNTAYGAYVWLAFTIFGIGAILMAAVLPTLPLRRAAVSAMSRGFFMAAGIPMRIQGLENLPQSGCIVVANHASYLDGVILKACLPPRFSFVIKNEVTRVPFMHFLLRRIGSKFVERFNSAGSRRDARSLLKAAKTGEALAFFPEGTFVAEPGLQRFRQGAFSAAIKGQLAVVPLVIEGSRHLLPAESLLPAAGPLHINILQPIPTTDPAYCDSRSLAHAARQKILAELNEPDLLAATAEE